MEQLTKLHGILFQSGSTNSQIILSKTSIKELSEEMKVNFRIESNNNTGNITEAVTRFGAISLTSDEWGIDLKDNY